MLRWSSSRRCEKDGVNFVLSATTRLEQRGDEKVVYVQQDGQRMELVGDQVLVGIGRAPNVDGMGLEHAGIKFDERKESKSTIASKRPTRISTPPAMLRPSSSSRMWPTFKHAS